MSDPELAGYFCRRVRLVGRGTQGYVWDTQSDMGYALLGALLSLLLLGRYHDRQLNGLQKATDCT